jgi:DNA-binding NarL/FixJ family response regulator
MRILIVDDNEPVRRGVFHLLTSETNWQVCGEASDGEEAVQRARVLHPDLILLDISMPRLNGLEVARLLRREIPRAKILIMSQHDSVQLLPQAIQAGAQGCVDKGRLFSDLIPHIKRIMTAFRADNPSNPG